MAEGDDTVSRYFLCFATLLAFVLLLSKFLKNRPRINAFLSEPAMVLMVGMFFSFVVRFLLAGKFEQIENAAEQEEQYSQGNLKETILSFPNKVFFMALLPPILFNSGYELQRELFYRHFKPIALFSALGTTISGISTGFALYGAKLLGWMGDFDPSFLELLAFGALIAATQGRLVA